MEELKQKLIEDCNSSGLPLEAILFIARDFHRDVEDAYRSMKAAQAREAAEQSLSNEKEEN